MNLSIDRIKQMVEECEIMQPLQSFSKHETGNGVTTGGVTPASSPVIISDHESQVGEIFSTDTYLLSCHIFRPTSEQWPRNEHLVNCGGSHSS